MEPDEQTIPSATATDILDLLYHLSGGDVKTAERIASYMLEVQVGEGEIVIEQGTVGDALFVVKQGSIEVSRRLDGDESRITVLGPGHVVGETALLGDEPRTARVTALTDSTLLKLSRDVFATLVERYPQIGLHLLKYTSARLLQQYRHQEQMAVLEQQLTHELKARHTELQDAYRQLEENSTRLQFLLKRVQLVRMIATVLIIALFLTAGFYAWNTNLLQRLLIAQTHQREAKATTEVATITVEPRLITSTLSLTGQIAPLRVVQVTSPISGTIAARHFDYGQRVDKGQKLFEIDTTELEVQRRDAMASYIQALQQMRKYEAWDQGPEMAQAHRSLTTAKMALDNAQRKLKGVTFLLERGVIPSSEYDAAKQDVANQQLSYDAALSGLEQARAQGGQEQRRIAQLQLDNAQTRLKEIEATMARSVVVAPVSGVALLQAPSEDKSESQRRQPGIDKGHSVSPGQVLVSIGDLEGFSVKSYIDEVDIGKVHQGQRVRVAGDAFPGTVLQGTLAYISSQAIEGTGRGTLPVFELRIDIPEVSEAQRQTLLLGMSADLEVIIYEQPKALVIPLRALQGRTDNAWVRVRDRTTGDVQKRPVEVGITTLNGVEILRGLTAGEAVVVR